MKSFAAAAAIAVVVAGCAAMGERQPHRYYVLEPAPAALMPHSKAVMPAPTTAASFYDTQDIVFSRSPGTRGYYQFNHWTERPQRVVHAALAARYGPRRGAYTLATEVVEIYHDAAEAPGIVRITVAAEIIGPTQGHGVSRRTFTRTAPSASHDAPGAVAAFDEAVGRVLDDIVEWTDREMALRGAQRPRPNPDPSDTTREGPAS